MAERGSSAPRMTAKAVQSRESANNQRHRAGGVVFGRDSRRTTPDDTSVSVAKGLSPGDLRRELQALVAQASRTLAGEQQLRAAADKLLALSTETARRSKRLLALAKARP